ncbi:MAG: hypothetical protein CVV24_12955 [Ignavibacteriae bacterium HGW-Ignavibacteriae-3]|nr:MAG: hypothetical protein CVV24_12955 [Ignavibacteriae bacterium HGW-Ignavibacteriae-3]
MKVKTNYYFSGMNIDWRWYSNIVRICLMSLILLIISGKSKFAQDQTLNFQIDFNEINGELTSKDLYKKDFGRYDGYNIDLYAGEAVNCIVYSNSFQPVLALVNSKGEIVKQSDKNRNGYANIAVIIPATDKLVLYVIGEEASRGKYTLQTSVAEPKSLYVSDGAEFCTKLDFLLAHSIAYFSFIDNPALTNQPLVKFPETVDVFIDEEDGAYKSVLYSDKDLSVAEISFKKVSDKIKSCLGTDWKYSSANWQRVEDHREKYVSFEETNKDKKRYVKVVLFDYTDSKQNGSGNSMVTLEISRNH